MSVKQDAIQDVAILLAIGRFWSHDRHRLAHMAQLIADCSIIIHKESTIKEVIMKEYLSSTQTRDAAFINWKEFINWEKLIEEVTEIGKFEVITYWLYNEEKDEYVEKKAVIEYC